MNRQVTNKKHDGQWTHEKMFNFTNKQKDGNQNNETGYYSGKDFKK